jgi:adenylate cyclase class 2
MQIEYEATFVDIDKGVIRKKLQDANAKLIRSEFLQKRAVFHLPKGSEIDGGWLRVRDEGDKITMSLKVIDGNTITDQKELCLSVDSFENACALFETIGCRKKAYQESKRELWILDDIEITIDEWPFLESFMEVEGTDELSVKTVSEKLDFDFAHARFCHVGTLYGEKYSLPEDVFNNHTPILIFDMENPFNGRS